MSGETVAPLPRSRSQHAKVLLCASILACLVTAVLQYWRIGQDTGESDVATPSVLAEPAQPIDSLPPERPVSLRAATTTSPQLLSPLQPGNYGIVARQTVQTLRDYEVIPVTLPTDPRAPSQKAASGGMRIEAWAPYWMNDDKSATKQAQNVAKAPEDLQKAFRQIPPAVRQGKGSPGQIADAVQILLATGYVRGAGDGWPPSWAEVAVMMDRFGIGVDCSAFVYEALSRSERALTAEGMAGLARPLEGPPTYVGSRVLATGGEKVASPEGLRVGDMMYRAPYPTHPVGHIRIIDDVQQQGMAIVFNTAEAKGDGITGPATRWWRYPDASKFASLEEFADGAWIAAESRELADVFARRFPTWAPGTPQEQDHGSVATARAAK